MPLPTPHGATVSVPDGSAQASHTADSRVGAAPSSCCTAGSTANRSSAVVAPGATSGGSARTANTRSLSMKLAAGRSFEHAVAAISDAAAATVSSARIGDEVYIQKLARTPSDGRMGRLVTACRCS